VAARSVRVPTLSRKQLQQSDDRPAEDFHRKNFKIERGLVEERKLRDFQVSTQIFSPSPLFILLFQIEGVNWLYYKWWSKQSGTILADEMVRCGPVISIASH
jgi:SNF2 family DNA or RNA helicase